ncbi:MAG: alpha/beta fold hydrolase [Candidatus Thorarchaeota archaeon]|jgi:pimeloyl-ACP methyl ester carboxylesterase
MSSTENGYAEVNGTRLYYEIAGEGESIVLIHGNGVDTRMGDDQFEAFAKQYKVLRYDARI